MAQEVIRLLYQDAAAVNGNDDPDVLLIAETV
jgi:hypothetical protein